MSFWTGKGPRSALQEYDDLVAKEKREIERKKPSPKVVVFCGSSRFVDIMAVVAWLVEREEGAITLGLHLLPAWYRSPDGSLPPDHLAEREGCAAAMDELHLRKIDLADEIFVVDVCGYIGESTAKEMAYAINRGKPIRRFSSDPIGRKVWEMATERKRPAAWVAKDKMGRP